MEKILIINAALNGNLGNTDKLLSLAEQKLSKNFSIERISLNTKIYNTKYLEQLLSASAFIFGTGVYWASWSSYFQKFLEDLTDTEGSEIWLGKPCAFVVTSHSFGASNVLSKLITTMNLWGCWTPPCCAMAYSKAEQSALKVEGSEKTEYWKPEHLNILCHNLTEAVKGTKNWKFWNDYPPDSLTKRWLE